ncbi:protein kinase domain-containing protein, partial [Cryptosporidium felis]
MKIDRDNDGRISREDFKQLLKAQKSKLLSNITKSFSSGSEVNYRTILPSSNQGVYTEWDSVLDEIDTNRDGLIDWKEFCAFIVDYFNSSRDSLKACSRREELPQGVYDHLASPLQLFKVQGEGESRDEGSSLGVAVYGGPLEDDVDGSRVLDSPEPLHSLEELVHQGELLSLRGVLGSELRQQEVQQAPHYGGGGQRVSSGERVDQTGPLFVSGRPGPRQHRHSRSGGVPSAPRPEPGNHHLLREGLPGRPQEGREVELGEGDPPEASLRRHPGQVLRRADEGLREGLLQELLSARQSPQGVPVRRALPEPAARSGAHHLGVDVPVEERLELPRRARKGPEGRKEVQQRDSEVVVGGRVLAGRPEVPRQGGAPGAVQVGVNLGRQDPPPEQLDRLGQTEDVPGELGDLQVQRERPELVKEVNQPLQVRVLEVGNPVSLEPKQSPLNQEERLQQLVDLEELGFREERRDERRGGRNVSSAHGEEPEAVLQPDLPRLRVRRGRRLGEDVERGRSVGRIKIQLWEARAAAAAAPSSLARDHSVLELRHREEHGEGRVRGRDRGALSGQKLAEAYGSLGDRGSFGAGRNGAQELFGGVEPAPVLGDDLRQPGVYLGSGVALPGRLGEVADVHELGAEPEEDRPPQRLQVAEDLKEAVLVVLGRLHLHVAPVGQRVDVHEPAVQPGVGGARQVPEDLEEALQELLEDRGAQVPGVRAELDDAAEQLVRDAGKALLVDHGALGESLEDSAAQEANGGRDGEDQPVLGVVQHQTEGLQIVDQ